MLLTQADGQNSQSNHATHKTVALLITGTCRCVELPFKDRESSPRTSRLPKSRSDQAFKGSPLIQKDTLIKNDSSLQSSRLLPHFEVIECACAEPPVYTPPEW